MNLDNCPLPGNVNVIAGSSEAPFSPTTSTFTATGVVAGFARATPVSILILVPGVLVSFEYISNAVAVGIEEKPASVTGMALLFLNVKISAADRAIHSL